MIVSLPRLAHRVLPRTSRKARPLSVAQILKKAYHRYTREKTTLLAVKLYLG
jgi:hypothetical protein